MGRVLPQSPDSTGVAAKFVKQFGLLEGLGVLRRSTERPELDANLPIHLLYAVDRNSRRECRVM